MFWVFLSLAIIGFILYLLVRQHIIKYGFPFAYCLIEILFLVLFV